MGDLREKRRRGKNNTHKGLCFEYPSMNKEERKINIWCINNNVRINPVPTKPGMFPEEWKIEIRLGSYKTGEKPHLSPSVYTHDNIHQEIRRMQKYYYEKHQK
jgi:hypothetical protein|tara:strand:+ start:1561 stop:1869 length:309 start_codon:yes stop_codon:yes gene_type:complete